MGLEALDVPLELNERQVAHRVRVAEAQLGVEVGGHHEVRQGVGLPKGEDHVVALEPQRPVEVDQLRQRGRRAFGRQVGVNADRDGDLIQLLAGDRRHAQRPLGIGGHCLQRILLVVFDRGKHRGLDGVQAEQSRVAVLIAPDALHVVKDVLANVIEDAGDLPFMVLKLGVQGTVCLDRVFLGSYLALPPRVCVSHVRIPTIPSLLVVRSIGIVVDSGPD